MSFCSIASIYKSLEYCVFGGKLQQARVYHLQRLKTHLPAKSCVLVVGDGDGRFTAELLRARPDLRVDYVESSAKMVKLAQQRVEHLELEEPVQWVNQDINEWSGSDYDLVVTHFLLDCFEGDEFTSLIKSLHAKMKPMAYWLSSDFNPSVSWWARIWVKLMYLFFRLCTSVKASSLTPQEPIFKALGMCSEVQFSSVRGFIYSSLWRKQTTTQ